jgi:hypothetical protein
MAKYKVKVKLLVRGFPSVIGNYEVDGFILKENKINEAEWIESIRSEEFDTRAYMTSVSFQLANDKNLTYNYFENINYYTIDNPVENEYVDIRELKLKLSDLLIKNEQIKNDIDCLEKKLRLIYNLPVKFPMRKFFIYDENNVKIVESMCRTFMPNDNGLSDFNQDEFYQRSRFNISIKSVLRIEAQNNNFKTAMDFFYNSFDIEDKNIRFVLLFSSLEAIFNLRNIKNNKIFKFTPKDTKEDKITTVISFFSSKFLFLESEEETKIKEERFRCLYGKRGNYIHGKKNSDISSEEEKELREYVREILLIYFMCCESMKMNKKESMVRKVLVDVYENKKLSIIIKQFVCSLRSKSYKETYDKIVQMIIKGIYEGDLEITEMENGCVTKVNEKV